MRSAPCAAYADGLYGGAALSEDEEVPDELDDSDPNFPMVRVQRYGELV